MIAVGVFSFVRLSMFKMGWGVEVSRAYEVNAGKN